MGEIFFITHNALCNCQWLYPGRTLSGLMQHFSCIRQSFIKMSIGAHVLTKNHFLAYLNNCWRDYSRLLIGVLKSLPLYNKYCSLCQPTFLVTVCCDFMIGWLTDYLQHYDTLAYACGLQGCKNRSTPFPGQMSKKLTKPSSVCLFLLCCKQGGICR